MCLRRCALDAMLLTCCAPPVRAMQLLLLLAFAGLRMHKQVDNIAQHTNSLFCAIETSAPLRRRLRWLFGCRACRHLRSTPVTTLSTSHSAPRAVCRPCLCIAPQASLAQAGPRRAFKAGQRCKTLPVETAACSTGEALQLARHRGVQQARRFAGMEAGLHQ